MVYTANLYPSVERQGSCAWLAKFSGVRLKVESYELKVSGEESLLCQ